MHNYDFTPKCLGELLRDLVEPSKPNNANMQSKLVKSIVPQPAITCNPSADEWSSSVEKYVFWPAKNKLPINHHDIRVVVAAVGGDCGADVGGLGVKEIRTLSLGIGAICGRGRRKSTLDNQEAPTLLLD
ncbi:Uncharacterized protein Fot_22641 [Forsythia ovata]|uniref:Uncharacterized protein n=1 Tax=Forsythia ovata TaxID=205694 RepID=A0ABD1UYB2_9LAMI